MFHSRTASFVLIGFVLATLILFAVFKIINTGRFIHMNIEIALLCAHICLIPNLTSNEVKQATFRIEYSVKDRSTIDSFFPLGNLES